MDEKWPKLNLPPIDPDFSREGNTLLIWDIIRRKHIVLTKEEWVRQHLVALLISHLAYPRSLIKVETQHHYGKKQKRSDILVYDRNGKPFLLVECKSWETKLNRSVLNQIGTYNKTLQCPFIAISNGMQHYCWQKKEDQYDPLNNFPNYS